MGSSLFGGDMDNPSVVLDRIAQLIDLQPHPPERIPPADSSDRNKWELQDWTCTPGLPRNVAAAVQACLMPDPAARPTFSSLLQTRCVSRRPGGPMLTDLDQQCLTETVTARIQVSTGGPEVCAAARSPADASIRAAPQHCLHGSAPKARSRLC